MNEQTNEWNESKRIEAIRQERKWNKDEMKMGQMKLNENWIIENQRNYINYIEWN